MNRSLTLALFVLVLLQATPLLNQISLISVRASSGEGCEDTIFFDNFESYDVGTFPSAGGWKLIYDGAGAEHQKVIDAVRTSGLKSFQLWGKYMWSACVRRSFITDAAVIGYEINVRVEDYGTTGANAEFGFYSDATETDYIRVSFSSNGRIYVDSYVPAWYLNKTRGPTYDLNTIYQPDTWYNVKVIIDRTTDTFSIWINNLLKGEKLRTNSSMVINSLMIGSSHAGVQVYYDDIKSLSTRRRSTI